jgi:hypothetical protein
MHTKKEEIIVYTIGIIGVIAILFYNLKSGVSLDSILLIFKDLSPLFITIMIFYIVEGLGSPKYEKAANRAIKKIRQKYNTVFSEDSTKNDSEKAEECLFFSSPKTSFIPLYPLKQGILEIRISFGTIENFEKTISRQAPDKEDRITNKKNEVKKKVIELLQLSGAKFKVVEKESAAVQIEFLSSTGYERIIENIVGETIALLQEKREI